MTSTVVPDWKACVVYSADGPQPHVVLENEKVKVLVAGLEPGQRIPAHPEAFAVYHILEGIGWMIVDEKRIPVQPGTTIITPDGSARGMEAETRLAFLATRIA